MGEIDKSIIQRVQEYLEFKSDNIWELYQLLRKSRNDNHPDHFYDSEARKTAEANFKLANNLLLELGNYIEQQQAANTPVLRKEDNELKEFFHLKSIDAKDAEIENLKSQKQYLEHVIDSVKDENERLQVKIEELSKDMADGIHEEIQSIYTPRKAWKGVGIVAILASLLATFPIVSEFLTKIGADSIFLIPVLQFISFVTLFNWVRSWLVNKLVENVEYEILNSPEINKVLNVTERSSRYSKDYVFYESDITAFLRRRLGFIHRLVLFGGLNKTIKILTDDIILQLDRKKLIKNVDADGLNKLFVVNKIHCAEGKTYAAEAPF